MSVGESKSKNAVICSRSKNLATRLAIYDPQSQPLCILFLPITRRSHLLPAAAAAHWLEVGCTTFTQSMTAEDLESGSQSLEKPEARVQTPPSPSSSHEEEHEEHRVEEDLEKLPSHTRRQKQQQQQQQHQNNDSHRPDLSRTTSTQSRPISLRKVPLAERHGLLGRLCLLYEAEEPQGYPRKIKWLITFIIALAAVAAPMGSSIILRERRLVINPGRKLILMLCSCLERHHRHIPHFAHSCEPFGSLVHVEHVDIPSMVVII